MSQGFSDFIFIHGECVYDNQVSGINVSCMEHSAVCIVGHQISFRKNWCVTPVPPGYGTRIRVPFKVVCVCQMVKLKKIELVMIQKDNW
jgi:hypothetical protein